MVKSKPCQPESKSHSKRNKPETEEIHEENMEHKVRKKRLRKEEAPVPDMVKQSVEPTESKNKKRRKDNAVSEGMLMEKNGKEEECTQKEKKKKKKKTEQPEQPLPVVAMETDQEDAQDEGVRDEDLSPEEKRVLERKIKKMLKKEEKSRLKEEGMSERKEDSKPMAPQQALDYLRSWSEDRSKWRFQKTRQTWLLQHMFDSETVPDQSFVVLLSYLEGLKGAARDTTVQKAEALVKEVEGGGEDTQLKAQRAREVIQLLS